MSPHRELDQFSIFKTLLSLAKFHSSLILTWRKFINDPTHLKNAIWIYFTLLIYFLSKKSLNSNYDSNLESRSNRVRLVLGTILSLLLWRPKKEIIFWEYKHIISNHVTIYCTYLLCDGHFTNIIACELWKQGTRFKFLRGRLSSIFILEKKKKPL